MNGQIKLSWLLSCTLLLSLSCEQSIPPADEEPALPQIQRLNATSLTVRPGEKIFLQCIASDPLGGNVTYRWSASDGYFTTPVTDSQTWWHAPEEEMEATIQVKVFNESGSTSKSLPITVTRTIDNRPPVIQLLDASAKSLYPNEVDTLTCTASDPDGDPIQYEWAASGGSFMGAMDQRIAKWIAPRQAGQFIVDVSVSDGHLSTTLSCELKVVDFPPIPELTLLTPENGEELLSTYFALRWSCSDSLFSGDEFVYQVYLGTEFPPPLLVESYGDTVLGADSLKARTGFTIQPNTIYRWQIEVQASEERERSSEIWSFVTGRSQEEALKEIFPLALGNEWVYARTTYSESHHPYFGRSRDTVRTIDTVRIIEMSEDLFSLGAAPAYHMVGPWVDRWFALSWDGLYQMGSDDAWSLVRQLEGYPQPTGTYLSQEYNYCSSDVMRVVHADSTMNVGDTSYEHCYIVTWSWEDGVCANSHSGGGDNRVYAPGYGLIRITSGSSSSYLDTWSSSHTINELVRATIFE